MGNQESSILCPKCYTFNAEESDFCNKCGALLEEKHDTLSFDTLRPEAEDASRLKPGDEFGKRYRIIEQIGRGGMGRVYKAEDLELNIIVALKMIRPKYSQNPQFIERFKYEMLSARSISHENVVRIFDLGEEKNIKYISMEYIKGQNLRDLIRTSGPLTAARAAEIARHICYALRAAHKHGIIHRDLKPSNIMIDNNGQVHVMDFGLAKSVSGLERKKPRAFAGTPKYVSPEQAKGAPVDHRTDIYSLGLLMFEMLTGKSTFDAESETEYLEKHITEPPPLASSINPQVPPYLDRIIERCLEKDLLHRYTGVEEVLRDLSKEEKRPHILREQPERKIALPVISVAAAVLIVIAAFLIFKGRGKGPPSPSPDNRISLAVVYLENNTGDSSLDHLCREFTHFLIFDLIQSTFIRPLTPNRIVDLHNELDLDSTAQYSTEDLKKIAERGGAGHILWGSFHKPGADYIVNLLLYQANPWEDVGSLTAQGTFVPTIVDELSYKIKQGLGLSETMIAADIDRNVEDITTASPEALKYYFEGSKSYEERKFKESNEALFQAVEIDPGFAMAYRKISLNYDYLHDMINAKFYLEKAMSHMDRMSDREKYLLQGYYAQYYSQPVQEAVQYYRDLVKLYPDDIDGNVQLGSVYRNLEEWDKAQASFEKLLEVDSANIFGYLNRAYIYKAKGLYEEAERLLTENQARFHSQAMYHRLETQLYIHWGKVEPALEALERFRIQDPDNVDYHRYKAEIHQLADALETAREEYSFMIADEDFDQQLRGRHRTALISLAEGRLAQATDEALAGLKLSREYKLQPYESEFLLLLTYLHIRMNALEEALEAADQSHRSAWDITDRENARYAHLYKGLAQLEGGDLAAAEETAVALKDEIEATGCQNFMRIYHLLMGAIALKKGDFSHAFDYLEMAYEALPYQKSPGDANALYLDALAQAAEALGDADKAKSCYQHMTALSTGKFKWGDLYALSHYKLAKIYQNEGATDQAAQHYQKFLDLWKDADPGLTEKQDASKQLKLLTK